MRRNTPAIFAILLMSVFVLSSACTSPANEKNATNSGLIQVTTKEISSYISFGEARQAFESFTTVDESNETVPVYDIYSRDVDNSGNAITWLFGVQRNNEMELLSYTRTGWKIIPLNTTFPSEKIMFDSIVSPGTLFDQNKDKIFSESSSSIPERRDLELKQGVYTLTISSGDSNRKLLFNATTGELIARNV